MHRTAILLCGLRYIINTRANALTGARGSVPRRRPLPSGYRRHPRARLRVHVRARAPGGEVPRPLARPPRPPNENACPSWVAARLLRPRSVCTVSSVGCK